MANIDALRGIAALLVMYFHATNTVANYPVSSPLRSSGSFGHYGVEMFFVISGFIIPYSMMLGGYKLKDFRRFAAKRFLRVEPAYLVSILFSVGVGLLVNQLYGRTLYAFSAPQLFSHLLYLTEFRGEEWVNPVYWTLAIEFQFYLLAGLAFPLIMHRTGRLALGGVALAAFLSNPLPWRTVIAFLPFFAMGTLCALYKAGATSLRNVLAAMLVWAVACWIKSGTFPMMVGIVSALVVGGAARLPRLRGLALAGAISYSVYLFHYPVVEKLVRIGKVAGTSFGAQVAVIGVAMATALALSWIAYKLVELPSLAAASRIRYSSTEPALALDAAPTR